MNIVYLKDHKEEVLQECLKRNNFLGSFFNELEIKEAIEAQIKNGLRYNTKTGATYCNDLGKCSKYVRKKDIPEYEDSSEVAKWEFSGFVRNSASRKKRGYSLI